MQQQVDSGEFLKCVSPDGNRSIELRQGTGGDGLLYLADDDSNARLLLEASSIKFRDTSNNVKGEVSYTADDFFTISGSSAGLVLSGSTVKVDGAFSLGTASFNGNEGKILLTDDVPFALDITEGSNSYVKFSSTNNNERVIFYKELRMADDVKLTFGGDAHIEYNEDSDDYLVISGSSKGMVLSGSETLFRSDQIEFGADTGASLVQLIFKGDGTDGIFNWYPAGDRFVFYDDLGINDDKKLKFGSASDAHIEYNEDGDDYLVLSGSSAGMVLSGSNIIFDGNVEIHSPDNINLSSSLIYFGDNNTDDDVDIRFLGSSNDGRLIWDPTGDKFIFVDSMRLQDDKKLYFGTGDETYIEYNEDGDNYLTVSGSSGGVALSGSYVAIDGKLGVGVYGTDITNAITLPNNDNATGQIKANAFVSYSSRRFKENIKKLKDPIKVIQSLEGVSYKWKNSGRNDFGFIAEDVGKTLPGIVQWEDNGKDASGIDYSRIISYLVEAVKEQQTQIEKLNQQLNLQEEKE